MRGNPKPTHPKRGKFHARWVCDCGEVRTDDYFEFIGRIRGHKCKTLA